MTIHAQSVVFNAKLAKLHFFSRRKALASGYFSKVDDVSTIAEVHYLLFLFVGQTQNSNFSPWILQGKGSERFAVSQTMQNISSIFPPGKMYF